MNFLFMSRQAIFRFKWLFTCLALEFLLKRLKISIEIDLNACPTHLNFMHRFHVLLEIRCTRERVVARLARKLLVVGLVNFLDMRVEVGLRSEDFSA